MYLLKNATWIPVRPCLLILVSVLIHVILWEGSTSVVNGFEPPSKPIQTSKVPPSRDERRLDADVGIVGAGPAGLVLAHALRKRGYSVSVLERRSSFSPVGAAVFMHPFALRSLRSVSPVLEEQLLKVCTAIRSIRILSPNEGAGLLFGTDQLDRAPSIMGAPFVTVRFWDMLCALKDGLPEEIFEFGCVVTNFTERSDGIDVHYMDDNGDSKTTTVSVLFDCGGIRSSIRKQLIGDEAIPRLKVTYAVAKSKRLGGEYRQREDNRVLAFVMGDGKSVTTANLPDGDIWWTQTQYDDDPRGNILQSSSGDLRSQLNQRFENWPSDIQRLVQATPADEMIESTLSEFRPVFRWGQGRVTLVGDAAHAQLPALGLGVSTAFADVAELCRQIDRHGLPSENSNGNSSCSTLALRWYEAVRIPQTAVLQIASRLAFFANIYIGKTR